MTFDSALVLLMAEISLATIVLAGTLFLIWRNKRHKEVKAINSFLNQMEERALLRNQPLDRLLTETCGLSPKAARETLQNVSDSERDLMQKIIQLFLQREMVLLNEIDRCIGNLAEPYCQLLNDLATAQKTSSGNDRSMERVNQQLIRQLETAMQTIDEITCEYTRVFSGNQTGLELENSSRKMLTIFQDSIRNLKQLTEEPPASKEGALTPGE